MRMIQWARIWGLGEVAATVLLLHAVAWSVDAWVINSVVGLAFGSLAQALAGSVWIIATFGLLVLRIAGSGPAWAALRIVGIAFAAVATCALLGYPDDPPGVEGYGPEIWAPYSSSFAGLLCGCALLAAVAAVPIERWVASVTTIAVRLNTCNDSVISCSGVTFPRRH
jgi:hypothetical protein